MKQINKIIELHKDGCSYNNIAKELNVSKSLVAYYCNEKKQQERLEEKQNSLRKKEEYEQLVCKLIKENTNLNKVLFLLNKRNTNTNYDFLKRIIEKYNIDTSHFTNDFSFVKREKISVEEIFCQNSKMKSTSNVKSKLIELGLKEWICEQCKRIEWNEQPIPLELHHINGNRVDNRLENLQLLCCNCHAQTENFCGKNIAKIIKDKNINHKLCEHNDIKSTLPSKCPPKEMLLEQYRDLGSFKKIGEYYKVSDNAVKKWFKKYDLPCVAKEIREYIISMYGKQPQWYKYMENRDMSNTLKKISKPIDVFNSDNELLHTYSSISEASKHLNIDTTTIRRICQGKKVKKTNLIFKYHIPKI